MPDAESPRAFTSIQTDDGMSSVFFRDKYGNIRTYTTQESQQFELADDSKGILEYNMTYVQVTKGTNIETKSADLASISWIDEKDPMKSFVRLYYVDSNRVISELCQDDGSPVWRTGNLSTKGYTAMENSPITAHINIKRDPKTKAITGKQLKVYFWAQATDRRPTVVFHTVDDPKNPSWAYKREEF